MHNNLKDGVPPQGLFDRLTCEAHKAKLIKFIYSEKATKFCKISNLLLPVCTVDKSKVEISQNFVALSEYTSFKYNYGLTRIFMEAAD